MKSSIAGFIFAALSVVGLAHHNTIVKPPQAVAAFPKAIHLSVATPVVVVAPSPKHSKKVATVYHPVTAGAAVLGTSTTDGVVTQSQLQTAIAQASNALRQLIYANAGTVGQGQYSTGGYTNNLALTNKIDQLNGTTLTNVVVNGVSGLTAANIPDLSSQYLPLSGGTVTGGLTVTGSFSGGSISLNAASSTNATFTNATSTNFFATNASASGLTVTGNLIGGRIYASSTVAIGTAAVSGLHWLNDPPYLVGVDAQNAVTNYVISPHGTYGSVSATRSSDNASLSARNIISDICVIASDNTSVAEKTWCRYEHGIVTATSAFYQHINDENSVRNLGPSISVDPYTTNPIHSTYNLRLDSSTGPSGNNVSAALDIVQNGGKYNSGIVFGNDALDTTTNAHPDAVALAPYQALTWYYGAGNKAWQIYSTSTSASGNLNISGVGNVVLPSANLGIGTTSPDTFLTINGSHPQMDFQDSVNGRSFYVGEPDGFNGVLNQIGGGNIFLKTNGTTLLTLAGGSVGSYFNSGNLGIGTTSPGSLFSINGIANFTAATSSFYSSGGFNLSGGCYAVNGSCLTTGVSSVTNGDGTLTISPTNGAITASLNSSHANAWTGLQQFNANASSTQESATAAFFGGTATLTFTSAGRLGIGTTSPDTFLTINGSHPQMDFQDSVNGRSFYVGEPDGFNGVLNQIGGGNIFFKTNNSTLLTLVGGSVAAYFTNANVGVGTSTPYSRFTIWGSDAASSTAAFSVINNASTTVFSVFDGGNAQLSGTLTQSSDQRLKTNIATLDASTSLAAINSLSPVAYDWLDPEKGGVRQYGFIAQQVQQVFPNLVSTTSATALTPDGTLGLNYLGLIAPLVEAVQGLSARLSSLDATIAGFAQSFTSKQVTATQQLCVDKSDGPPVCVTGDQLAGILSGTPSVQISAPTPPMISGTTTPPSINIQGSNPATINVGDIYTDFGAIVHDNQGHDLSYRIFINGVLSGNILVDTSQVATDTIDYVATDTWGNTATSTRTIIIGSTASSSAQ
jgi:hypothetical protein